MSAAGMGNSQPENVRYGSFLPGLLLQEQKQIPQIARGLGPDDTAWSRYMPRMTDGPLRRICDCIDRNLVNPDLSPALIAQDLAMSRATLYRFAKPLGGIQRFVRKRRLQYAFALIKTDALAVRSISVLAYDLGFSSENTFRRAFKDMFGMSPSTARTAALTSE